MCKTDKGSVFTECQNLINQNLESIGYDMIMMKELAQFNTNREYFDKFLDIKKGDNIELSKNKTTLLSMDHMSIELKFSMKYSYDNALNIMITDDMLGDLTLEEFCSKNFVSPEASLLCFD